MVMRNNHNDRIVRLKPRAAIVDQHHAAGRQTADGAADGVGRIVRR